MSDLRQTYDSRPTPKPATTLPATITQNPGVKVWIAPPRAKTTAPMNNVPRRPNVSPMRPAAIEVTVGAGELDRHALAWLRSHQRHRLPEPLPLSRPLGQ